jgi:hypothetical protein
MKVVKGLSIFSFFCILLGSCFDPPEFPDVPQIMFSDVYFCDLSDQSKRDTLVVSITFKDGDGDLGLDARNPEYSADPFNFANFYQDVNGSLQKIPVGVGEVNSATGVQLIDVLNIADPGAGEIIFPRTRKWNSDYSGLPLYTCKDYIYREFIVHSSDTAALDKFSSIKDTLKNDNGTFYLIQDTLYFERNPDHYNIEVDFLVKTDPANIDPEKRFTEFDWWEEAPCETYDGRFPFLTDNENALDGTLRYQLSGFGFNPLFATKTLKLRIQIKDRLLHKSNIVETPEFTLQSIRRCN